MLPGDRSLIDTGYKYNLWKFLSFVATKDTDSTKADILYLSKYPGQFSNVAIRPVAFPLFISKFFGSVNRFNSHYK